MKISQLIEGLAKFMQYHGDIEVVSTFDTYLDVVWGDEEVRKIEKIHVRPCVHQGQECCNIYLEDED